MQTLAVIPPVSEWDIPLRYQVLVVLGSAHMMGKIEYREHEAVIKPFEARGAVVTEEHALTMTEALNGQYWHDLDPSGWSEMYSREERARLKRYYEAICKAKERARNKQSIGDKVEAWLRRGKPKRKTS
jgi:hypothetical protein